ncbi:MAG: glycosyltransferase family 2 protein [Actinobacteria bacterium]|nr:glycosyltransferase family 2 protein [Actinomycetota bacterium]
MSDLPFHPYRENELPVPGSVRVTALVLTRDEEVNIVRCLRSLRWCAQVVVVDSGSTDRTVALAEQEGAVVVHQPWLGFAGQREAALRMDIVQNDWVYFVDADEWTSAALAREVESVLTNEHAAYRHRLRLVFLGTWIEHCGWYGGSWVVRLGRRSEMSFAGGEAVGERAQVHGTIGVLRHDIVDEDLKGLPAWLRKHVTYAEVEAARRSARYEPAGARLRRWARGERAGRSASRSFAKDVAFPTVPARPLMLFLYMYFLRSGWRHGRAGLMFCLLHAWHEMVVGELTRDSGSEPRKGSGRHAGRPRETWPTP